MEPKPLSEFSELSSSTEQQFPHHAATAIFGKDGLHSPDPRAEFLRPLPTAGLVTGSAMVCGLLLDLSLQLPGDAANVAWRIGFLEKLFDSASLLVLGMALMSASVWFADLLQGYKHRKLGMSIGVLSTLMSAGVLLSVPLYSMDAQVMFNYQREQLNEERRMAHPLPGSYEADRFELAARNMQRSMFQTAFRRNGLAILSGLVLLILGAQAIRQARRRRDVTFCCPNCLAEDVRTAPWQSDTEKSLAFWTRIHTFVCIYCNERFRRFSLTGRPFPFLF